MASEEQMWMCTRCWHIRPRSAVEKDPPGDAPRASRECENCGSSGSFVSEQSGEFAAMANDLLFEAYAAKVRIAGYPISSNACDLGAHKMCSGLAEDNEPCGCDCHSAV